MAGCFEHGSEPSRSMKVELLIHLDEYQLLSKVFCTTEELLVSSKEVRDKTKEEEEREKPERERERENKKDERKKKENKMENSWNVVANFNRRVIFYFTSPNLLAHLLKQVKNTKPQSLHDVSEHWATFIYYRSRTKENHWRDSKVEFILPRVACSKSRV